MLVQTLHLAALGEISDTGVIKHRKYTHFPNHRAAIYLLLLLELRQHFREDTHRNQMQKNTDDKGK